jgi:cellulose synthase/poly-beta-1,6-N-acetylglucosamine synthase-like glycosyltransferase
MYRIKSTTESRGEFVPLLVNPDIVACYSENIVDTLHKKNLLLLGEDRFLSTLMLGTFPKRKMVYVPQAVCHTTVPHTYKILQSQRRRWINSTIHNLLELVFLPTLCGTFCLSMQFVIAVSIFRISNVAFILTYFSRLIHLARALWYSFSSYRCLVDNLASRFYCDLWSEQHPSLNATFTSLVSSWNSGSYDYKKARICALDVCVFVGFAYLELFFTDLCVLAL